jgi:hypothetical protein
MQQFVADVQTEQAVIPATARMRWNNPAKSF